MADQRWENALQITANALQQFSQSDLCNQIITAYRDRNITPQERLLKAGKINETSYIISETISQLMQAQAEDEKTFNNWLTSTKEIALAIVKLQHDLTDQANADHKIIESMLNQIHLQNNTNNETIVRFMKEIHDSTTTLNEAMTGQSAIMLRKQLKDIDPNMKEEDVKYYINFEVNRFVQECKFKIDNLNKTHETIQNMSKDLRTSSLKLIELLNEQMKSYDTYKNITNKRSFELQQAMQSMQEKALEQRRSNFQNFLNQGLEVVKFIYASKSIQPAPGQPAASNLIQPAPGQLVAQPGLQVPTKFCPNCGAPNPRNFCSNCGEKFT